MMRRLSLALLAALCVALCGAASRPAPAAAAVRNSIKHPASGASAPTHTHTHTVSARPSGGGREEDTDVTQPLGCAVDSECRTSEFCNAARSVCMPCRKRRKRCARHAMCCSGSFCVNGVCQAAEVNSTVSVSIADMPQQVSNSEFHTVTVTAARVQNITLLPEPPRRTSVPSKTQQILKGGEGEACLRSSDCAEGLCCARHFWSRICKPVLTEGQVCTRHRRKGTHSLEIFQRCDCGQGLVCRAQRDRPGAAEGQQQQQPIQQQQQHSNTNRAARNLHTCQPR
ncbi:dickkopf WNT signaling pathway inhibitor 1a [Colossoma macropomum]|uniref:dickkopf WNT signaling pathway inhibitor 1a n=1 Tax=Colossoma macropomum TaxID=42526 RepID=UPI0018642EF9|nr:dickkopf WNT signaling pathway inhibitor 1a [Colossoma macropomum]